jgi:biofilm PGA synthesis N-glycosyltransferase PgaC
VGEDPVSCAKDDRLVLETARVGGSQWKDRPGVGWRPAVRFVVAAIATVIYIVAAINFSDGWRAELREAIGPVMAWVIPVTLAYVPGLVIWFMIFTLLTLRYRLPEPPAEWPAVTVVVAAWNEEHSIERTIERIAEVMYPGPLEVVLADNNSTDRTAELAQAVAESHRLRYRRVFEEAPGKHTALNTALASVTTPILVTVDADTFVHPSSLRYLVARLHSSPQGQHTSACAGALIVENVQTNFLTRMQGWDYRLGINAVKRMQSAYNSALVAQGAFSAYWTDDLRAVGGWPNAIGEDIVLTWALLASRGITQYEPCALAYTAVPERVNHLRAQRSRWARGMFESLKTRPPRTQPRFLAKVVSGIDYLVPLLDVGYVFFWIPGVILFVFGHPLIFSWWSMLVLPITLVIFGLMNRWQQRNVFVRLDIHLKRDMSGFLGYLFGYQALTSSAALRGYAQYLSGAARRWR